MSDEVQRELVDGMLTHLELVTGGDTEGLTTRAIFECVAVVVAGNIGPCDQVGHNYKPGEAGYHKSLFGSLNKSQSYARLFCTKCGDTIEVPWADHRPAQGGKAKG